MQYLTNRGAAEIAPVYTFEVTNYNYLRVDQSWNWVVSAVNGDGTAIGTVKEVKPELILMQLQIRTEAAMCYHWLQILTQSYRNPLYQY